MAVCVFSRRDCSSWQATMALMCLIRRYASKADEQDAKAAAADTTSHIKDFPRKLFELWNVWRFKRAAKAGCQVRAGNPLSSLSAPPPVSYIGCFARCCSHWKLQLCQQVPDVSYAMMFNYCKRYLDDACAPVCTCAPLNGGSLKFAFQIDRVPFEFCWSLLHFKSATSTHWIHENFGSHCLSPQLRSL